MDTLFFPGTAAEIGPHTTSHANDVKPSPLCSTACLPSTAFLQLWGQNLRTDSNAQAPDTRRGRRGNKSLLLGDRLPTTDNKIRWIYGPHTQRSTTQEQLGDDFSQMQAIFFLGLGWKVPL